MTRRRKVRERVQRNASKRYWRLRKWTGCQSWQMAADGKRADWRRRDKA